VGQINFINSSTAKKTRKKKRNGNTRRWGFENTSLRGGTVSKTAFALIGGVSSNEQWNDFEKWRHRGPPTDDSAGFFRHRPSTKSHKRGEGGNRLRDGWKDSKGTYKGIAEKDCYHGPKRLCFRTAAPESAGGRGGGGGGATVQTGGAVDERTARV